MCTCEYLRNNKRYKNSDFQINLQVLKLQEAPESIPQGEMPRHLTVYCDRTLCERVAPGARVTVLGIYSIKKIAKVGVSIEYDCHLRMTVITIMPMILSKLRACELL